MGVILSRGAQQGRQKGVKESAYERELAALDAAISRHELSLSETRVSERRTSVYLFFYSMLVIAGSWAFVFFAKSEWRPAWLDFLLVVGVPVVVYYGRQAVAWFYRRRIGGLEVALQTLRQKQHLKLEELKDASGYYQTRGLIERFDPEFKKSNGLAALTEPLNVKLKTESRTEPIQELAKPAQLEKEEKVAFVLPVEPKKTWMDRLVDAMIGDDSRHSKYALICKRCHAHNGLALPDEIMTVVFVCPNCHYENHPRPRDNLVINGENVYTPVKDEVVEPSTKADPDTPQALRRRKN